MIDLMIAAMRNELDKDCGDSSNSLRNNEKAKLDESLVVATAMVLLVAGYDTSGSYSIVRF